MPLRDYQQEAVLAIYRSIGSGRGLERPPVCVVPTGAGKSHIIAQMCLDTIKGSPDKNILVLTHQKEILLQNAAKLAAALGSDDLLSFYCAGINQKKDPSGRVVYASIQSCVNDADKLYTPNHKIAVIFVDEAHRIPQAKESQYRRFLESLYQIAGTRYIPLIGFTATPFRTNEGLICGEEDKQIFKTICYQLPVQRLVDGGYLTTLKTYVGEGAPDFSSCRIEHGDYKSADLESVYCVGNTTQKSVEDIVARVKSRKRILVFCSTIRHAELVRSVLSHNTPSPIKAIYGDTPKEERETILQWFVEDSPEQRYLINVGVLTTGYDAPCIDCVVLLRATCSASLYVQMVGRGMRLFPGKQDCLILDYGDNIRRLGSLRELEATHGFVQNAFGEYERDEEPKERKRGRSCPKCGFYNEESGAEKCPDCGEEYPKREVKTTEEASDLDIMGAEEQIEEHIVADEAFTIHTTKRGSICVVAMYYCWDKPYPLRAYYVWESAWPRSAKVEGWYHNRVGGKLYKYPMPATAKEVRDMGNAGFPVKCRKIQTIKRSKESFTEVREIDWGDSYLPDPYELAEGESVF